MIVPFGHLLNWQSTMIGSDGMAEWSKAPGPRQFERLALAVLAKIISGLPDIMSDRPPMAQILCLLCFISSVKCPAMFEPPAGHQKKSAGHVRHISRGLASKMTKSNTKILIFMLEYAMPLTNTILPKWHTINKGIWLFCPNDHICQITGSSTWVQIKPILSLLFHYTLLHSIYLYGHYPNIKGQ